MTQIHSMIRYRVRLRGPAGCVRGGGVLLTVSPVAWGITAMLSFVAMLTLAGLRVNLSGSMPVGLYKTVSGQPFRGSIVLACLEREAARLAVERGYVPVGGSCPGGAMPVGKRVVAVPGDTVFVALAGISVNGIPVPGSEPLPADSRGRPMPQLPTGRHVVGPREFWLLSGYSPRSFDSRYFGPINAESVRTRLCALWTPAVPLGHTHEAVPR